MATKKTTAKKTPAKKAALNLKPATEAEAAETADIVMAQLDAAMTDLVLHGDAGRKALERLECKDLPGALKVIADEMVRRSVSGIAAISPMLPNYA